MDQTERRGAGAAEAEGGSVTSATSIVTATSPVIPSSSVASTVRMKEGMDSWSSVPARTPDSKVPGGDAHGNGEGNGSSITVVS